MEEEVSGTETSEATRRGVDVNRGGSENAGECKNLENSARGDDGATEKAPVQLKDTYTMRTGKRLMVLKLPVAWNRNFIVIVFVKQFA